MLKKSANWETLNGERLTRNKETIVTSAFRVHRSKFSCSLAAALPAEWRVLARRGWAGEKAAFLSILWGGVLLDPQM
jgi:hypothetical protein